LLSKEGFVSFRARMWKKTRLSLNLSSNVGSLLLQDSQLPKSEQKNPRKEKPITKGFIIKALSDLSRLL